MPAISLYDPRLDGGLICGNTWEKNSLGFFIIGTLGIRWLHSCCYSGSLIRYGADEHRTIWLSQHHSENLDEAVIPLGASHSHIGTHCLGSSGFCAGILCNNPRIMSFDRVWPSLSPRLQPSKNMATDNSSKKKRVVIVSITLSPS